MSTDFQQTNGTFLCSKALYCASNFLSFFSTSTHTEEGGTAGTTTARSTLIHGGRVYSTIWMSGLPGSGLTYNSGTWTVRLNITGIQGGFGFGALTLEDVYICHLNGSCVNQGSIGSNTGIGTALSVGTLTATVTGGAAPGTWDSNSRFMVILGFKNTYSGTRWIDWKNDKIVTTPFTPASVSWNLDNPAVTLDSNVKPVNADLEMALSAIQETLKGPFASGPTDIEGGGGIDDTEPQEDTEEVPLGGGGDPDPDLPPGTGIPPVGGTGDGQPGQADWLGGLWSKTTYPKEADGFTPKGYYIPNRTRLWSLNKCGLVLWGFYHITSGEDDPDGVDSLDYFTDEWTEEAYGFDRPCTLNLVRATQKDPVDDRHKEWCAHHFGHYVQLDYNWDMILFSYECDDTGKYTDPGYAQVQDLLPGEVEDGSEPIFAVNTSAYPDFINNPATGRRYIEAGEECFVSGMKLPAYYHGWLMDTAVYCEDVN